jgi:hypothetical protein
MQNFLDFFFLFFFGVILSIVMHLYAVRGVEGDLFRSRTEMWTNTNSMSRFPTKDVCPRYLVGSVRVHRQVSASNSTTLEMKCYFFST